VITISLCMIVRNEEDVLARCLESIRQAVDEIVIVDTGSTDQTVEIAKNYTNRIYNFDWIDDFAAARNFSFSKATCDYIMWMDADDIILPDDLSALLQLKENLDFSVDLVMMPYHSDFDSEGRPLFLYERERLFKREMHYRWQGEIHEAISPYGKILHSPVAITHRKERAADPDRNLRIFEKLLAKGKELDPRQQYYYARELAAHGRDREAVQWFSRFLDERMGWVENRIGACLDLAGCLERLGESEQAMETLARSFAYDLPRPEICCGLGRIWMQKLDYHQAIYWYERALHCAPPNKNSFCQPDYWDFIPYLQLCVCYEHLNRRSDALFYHEKAKRLKPRHPSVQYNETYFYG
jgi:glycosyltransferase involved in cell wall biosynthesis